MKKNRRILAKYNTRNRIKVRRSKLLREGFDFDLITSLSINSEGFTCFFCYEQGYMSVDEESVILICREDHKACEQNEFR